MTRAHPVLVYCGRHVRHHVELDDRAPALSIRDLRSAYPHGDVVLRGVSCELGRGRLATLVGANGSGKSTLLKCVAGLLAPMSGMIEVFGRPVGACHHAVAYLAQSADLDWSFPMTVERLVISGLYVHLGWFRAPGSADRRVVSEALERLGLAAIAGRSIGDLSGGQRRRVLIARALVQGARLLLLRDRLDHCSRRAGRRFQGAGTGVLRSDLLPRDRTSAGEGSSVSSARCCRAVDGRPKARGGPRDGRRYRLQCVSASW